MAPMGTIMATLHKFDVQVQTTQVAGEWESWIKRADLPTEVLARLTEKFPGEGAAWLIRLDRWANPSEEGQVYRQTHTLALNDATMPCIVNGNVDYSAWDD